MTTQELELLDGMSRQGSDEDRRRLSQQLDGEGRRDLRKYIELKTLRERSRRPAAGSAVARSMDELLDRELQFYKDKLTQNPLTMDDLDSRIKSLESLNGKGSDFESHHRRLLESYRQIRVRLGNRHGDEK